AALGELPPFADGAPPADDIAVLVIRRAADRLHLRSSLTEIDRLAEKVAWVGREHALPEELVSDLRLALEEAVTNVIRHGYGGRAGGGNPRRLHPATQAGHAAAGGGPPPLPPPAPAGPH